MSDDHRYEHAGPTVKKRRIVQIIPADDWWAEYKLGDDESSAIVSEPLVCWALVEDEDGFRHVVGIVDHGDGVTDLVDMVENFEKYEHNKVRPELRRE